MLCNEGIRLHHVGSRSYSGVAHLLEVLHLALVHHPETQFRLRFCREYFFLQWLQVAATIRPLNDLLPLLEQFNPHIVELLLQRLSVVPCELHRVLQVVLLELVLAALVVPLRAVDAGLLVCQRVPFILLVVKLHVCRLLIL